MIYRIEAQKFGRIEWSRDFNSMTEAKRWYRKCLELAIDKNSVLASCAIYALEITDISRAFDTEPTKKFRIQANVMFEDCGWDKVDFNVTEEVCRMQNMETLTWWGLDKICKRYGKNHVELVEDLVVEEVEG